ncbi:MAG: aminotransferase class V-fold PLP-dependent enzyme [Phycisphaerales bacterium]|nr:aminotransferase class V-fold PLP-dependent enzyme [Phycisphaerales bacterium]
MTRPPARLYMDNAATSSPKPPGVLAAIADYLERLGGSPGRGNYHESREAGRMIERCRQRLALLFNAERADHVVFTLNTTDALNLAIKGVVSQARRAGVAVPHVVTSAMDHNSVLRPLNALEAAGLARVTRVEPDASTGRVDPALIASAADRPGTVLVALSHASNVTGTLQDAAAVGRFCRARDVLFLLDAAQSAGHVRVDMPQLHADLLAFPGHKGLLGPTGTGGLIVRPGVAERLDTVREGGTGSRSEHDTQPSAMPDRFEAGSHNALGLAGLGEAVRFILDFEHAGLRGIDAVAAHERELCAAFLGALGFGSAGGPPAGLRLLGPASAEGRVGVFSFVIDGLDPHELSAILESEHGVLTRSGFHCAPLAHRALGTSPHAERTTPAGATRLSFGPFLTVADVQRAARALVEITSHVAVTAG